MSEYEKERWLPMLLKIAGHKKTPREVLRHLHTTQISFVHELPMMVHSAIFEGGPSFGSICTLLRLFHEQAAVSEFVGSLQKRKSGDIELYLFADIRNYFGALKGPRAR